MSVWHSSNTSSGKGAVAINLLQPVRQRVLGSEIFPMSDMAQVSGWADYLVTGAKMVVISDCRAPSNLRTPCMSDASPGSCITACLPHSEET